MDQALSAAPLVLVVEDDADAREMYEVLLAASGFRVVSAGNGVEGIDRARSLRPQLILMDLSLPAVNGLEASRKLKGDAATRDIPIVALSGNPIDDPGGRWMFAAALLKPCLPDDLVAEVRRQVGEVHR
jgi:two-component system cell cycle response regulator DivK